MEISGLGLHNPAAMLAENFRVNSQNNFDDILRRASEAGAAAQNRSGQAGIDRDSQLFQLCLELETFLVKNLLNSMRNTIQKTGLIDDSFAGKMYEDMLWDEKAKDFTRNAGFGLAEQAYRQLRNL